MSSSWNEPSSSRYSIRSRAVILPLACWRSTALGRAGVQGLFLARLSSARRCDIGCSMDPEATGARGASFLVRAVIAPPRTRRLTRSAALLRPARSACRRRPSGGRTPPSSPATRARRLVDDPAPRVLDRLRAPPRSRPPGSRRGGAPRPCRQVLRHRRVVAWSGSAAGRRSRPPPAAPLRPRRTRPARGGRPWPRRSRAYQAIAAVEVVDGDATWSIFGAAERRGGSCPVPPEQGDAVLAHLRPAAPGRRCRGPPRAPGTARRSSPRAGCGGPGRPPRPPAPSG